MDVCMYVYMYRWGVEVDVAGAVQKFERAVELGDAGGWVGLGFVHYYGLGEIAQNKSLALEYYRKVCGCIYIYIYIYIYMYVYIYIYIYI